MVYLWYFTHNIDMLASRFSYLKQIVRNRIVYSTYRAITLNVNNRKCSTVPQDDRKSLVRAVTNDKSLMTLHCQNGHDFRFHHVWLRHHCPCEACLDAKTKQRTINMALIPGSVRPQEVKVDSNNLKIVWEDGHQTSYEMSWLRQNAYDDFTQGKVKRGFGSIADEAKMLLWNNEIIAANSPPEYKYHDLQNNDDLVRESLNSIFRYGFIFVNETPTDEDSLITICKRIGGVVYDNLYGRICTLETNVFTKPDIAYSNSPLTAHTDHVFFSEPAGMAAMHIIHHDGTGGVTLLVDGFLAAKTLHEEDPKAYKILTSTEVPFQLKYDEYCPPSVHGPLLELDPFTQELMRIRYNTSRFFGPFVNMNLTFYEMEEFYRAITVFDCILRRPENELWFKLDPGRVLVMDNRRTLHGRSAITGSRVIMNCYVGMDDYMGRWKKNNMES